MNTKKRSKWGVVSTVALGAAAICLSLACTAGAAEYLSGIEWAEPKVVDPGPVGGPPSDAIVLFDGKDMSAWEGGEDWIVKDGAVTSDKHSVCTKQPFGDVQLHLEFAEPAEVEGTGQGRGNSGVLFMDGRYEVQVLDSYDNTTYYDGQAAAIYKQHPPLVNACRKPGEWQTYDIIFMAPKFDDQGGLVEPAYVTVLQNGVLVQNHFKLEGDTPYNRPPKYTAHPAKLPLQLQYHHNPVRFRNIWIREIKEIEGKRVAEPRVEPAPGKKKAAGKKAPAAKAPSKKAPVEKAPAEKAPGKKAPVAKAPSKKTPAEKAPVEKASGK